MQWVWILPSLGYGIYIFVTSGQPTGLIFAGFSVLAVAAGAIVAARREPIDLSAPVHFRSAASGSGSWRVAIGNTILPKWQWLWKAAWVGRVYGELESQNFERNSQLKIESKLAGSLGCEGAGLTAWMGFSGLNEVILDLPNEGAHGLIVGPTGSGKSQLLTCWLVSLAQSSLPAELNFWLVDFKGGATFGPALNLPWVAQSASDLSGDAVDLLGRLEAELQSRELLCAHSGVGRVDDLPAGKKPATIILAIDEAQALLADSLTHSPLASLAARGRSLGIHLILTVQSLNGVPRSVLANLGVRIAVGKGDAVELAQLGYQRSSTTPLVGGQPNPVEVKTRSEGWGSAVLITQVRQLNFVFPSSGKVGFSRLSAPDSNHPEIDLGADAAPFGQDLPQKPSESVVIPKNTFDFSIGLEKQLQLTAENVRE